MMHFLKNLFCIVLFFSAINPSLTMAQEVRPESQWKILQTAHFEVIFNAKQHNLAVYYAQRLEKAHQILQKYFSQAPAKTVVILNDKTDATNGYATRIPYPHIMIYPVLPSPQDGLSEYDDWVLEIVTHEYTHILTFEAATGVMRPLRAIFGSVVAPNILMPGWWKEGIAVSLEGVGDGGGRLRSTYQDAVIRALVLKNSLPQAFPIEAVNEAYPEWPEGLRPYLFGSLMWNQMISEKGPKVIDDLHLQQGGRVPYFIEKPARQNLGSSYGDFYDQTLNKIQTLAVKQIQVLQQQEFSKAQDWYQLGQKNIRYSSNPILHAQQKYMAFIAVDPRRDRSIKIYQRQNPQQSFLQSQAVDLVSGSQDLLLPSLKDAPPSGGIQRAFWFHNSAKLVFDKIDFINKVERFSDLYTYDLDKKTTDRLTRGLRAREPAVSLDDQSLVFVQLSGGKTRLVELDLRQRHLKTLLQPPLQERISFPIYWDEDYILFSWRKNNTEKLYRIDRQTLKTEEILSDFPTARFAVKTSAGLFFVSNKNGVFNIYQSTDLQTAKAVTHVPTSIFSMAYDEGTQELICTVMTDKGPQLQFLKPQNFAELPKAEPLLKPLTADSTVTDQSLAQGNADGIAVTSVDAKNISVRDYSPWSYLIPRYWIPFVATSSNQDGLLLQAQTSGFDPLKYHNYSLLLQWDTGKKAFEAAGTYLNQSSKLPWLVQGGSESDSVLGSTSLIETKKLGLGLVPDTWDISRYSQVVIGWDWQEKKIFTNQTHKMGPYISFAYSNASAAGEEISPESGQKFFLQYNNFVEHQNDIRHTQYLGKAQIYFSKYLPDRHSFTTSVEGLYIPEPISAFEGTTNTSLPGSDLLIPQFLTRGYKSGQFWGRQMAAVHAEYRFPIQNIFRGSGTDPYFLRRLYGSVVTDGLALKGIYYDDNAKTYYPSEWSKSFWSYGAQAHLETTLGYVLPLQVIIGYYWANDAGKANQSLALSLVMGSL
ncbi:MAG: hypothetical protein ACOYOK_03195 [Pseudobdellovibrionaceae bacterium]